MQLRWKTISRVDSSSLPETLKLVKVFPAYGILRFFQLIPSQVAETATTVRSRFRRISCQQATVSLLVVGFLLVILVYDFCIFLLGSQLLGTNNKGNRIINLLVSIRNILIFWRNCCSIFLVVWKSAGVPDLINALNDLLIKLSPARSYYRKHARMFLILYLIPFLLMGTRVTTAVIVAKMDERVDFRRKPAGSWAKNFADFFAEVFGGIIAVAAYIQICAFARVLKVCCHQFNKKLIQLEQRVVRESELSTVTFQAAILELRAMHEALIGAYHIYEDLFSLQILAAILNNIFIVFSAMASFFEPAVSGGAIAVYTLSIASFLYIILILPFFTIGVGEESEKTVEILQAVVHKREAVAATPCRKSSLEEFALLSTFLHRVVSKPLVVTAGGLMYLNRGFLISLGAVAVAFTLFLMERVEGQLAAAGEGLCGNFTCKCQ